MKDQGLSCLDPGSSPLLRPKLPPSHIAIALYSALRLELCVDASDSACTLECWRGGEGSVMQ